jgi:pimeloyl-ACP methyl ester carboxylesterase
VSSVTGRSHGALSRSDVAGVLTTIWESLLDVDVAPDDDFFEIGGYSLLIVDVVSQARQAGLDLAAKDVYQHRTIERLTATLSMDDIGVDPTVTDIGQLWHDSGNPWSPEAPSTLVPLRATGTGEPVFFIHWGVGNVDFLSRLRAGIAGDRPVYGIEAAGYRHPVRPLLSICEMAEYYLAQVRAVQPHGPYHLCGVCQGGLVGLEMARRLRADGEEVPVLAVVNLPEPEPFLDPGWGLADVLDFRMESLRNTYGIEDLTTDLPRVLPEFTELGWYSTAAPEDFVRYQFVWSAGVFAQEHHQPRPYDGPVLMFHLTGYDAAIRARWAPYLSDVRIHTVDAPDHTLPVLTSDVFHDVLGRELR